MRRPPGLTAALAAFLLAAGCGSGDDEADGAGSRSAATAGPSASEDPSATASAAGADEILDDYFAVEEERELHIRCRGGGPGTILLEAGGGSGGEDWPSDLVLALGEKARVCAYDRAGTGQSDDPPERRRTMADVTADLDKLLEAVGIDGRLLLAGTSFGGEAAYAWALKHPERTAGLVILDTDWPTTELAKSTMSLVSKEERAQFEKWDAWDYPDNVENLDYQHTAAEDEKAFRTLPGIPIRILSAAESLDCRDEESAEECNAKRAKGVKLQEQWTKLSPTVRIRVVDGPHDLPNEATGIVVEEILAALSEADFDAAADAASPSPDPS